MTEYFNLARADDIKLKEKHEDRVKDASNSSSYEFNTWNIESNIDNIRNIKKLKTDTFPKFINMDI